MVMKSSNERTYEVKYTGYLTESESVFLHYGYTNWNDVSEKKMRKLKSCYKAEVTLPADSEFNFCFRNDDGSWDNNSGNNYFFAPGYKGSYEFVEISNKEAKTTTSKTTKTTKTATAKTSATKTKAATISTKTATKTKATNKNEK